MFFLLCYITDEAGKIFMSSLMIRVLQQQRAFKGGAAGNAQFDRLTKRQSLFHEIFHVQLYVFQINGTN